MSMQFLIGTCNDQNAEMSLRSVLSNKEPDDEIYIIDDFSDRENIDRLRCICPELIIFQNHLTTDMAEQVNVALKQMPMDVWTVYLDGDECVGKDYLEGIYGEIYKAGKVASIKQYFIHTLWGDNPGDLWTANLQHCQKGYSFDLPKIDVGRLFKEPTYAVVAGVMSWPDVRVRTWINTPNTRFIGKVHKVINKDADWISTNPKTVIYHHKHISRFAKRAALYHKLEPL